MALPSGGNCRTGLNGVCRCDGEVPAKCDLQAKLADGAGPAGRAWSVGSASATGFRGRENSEYGVPLSGNLPRGKVELLTGKDAKGRLERKEGRTGGRLTWYVDLGFTFLKSFRCGVRGAMSRCLDCLTGLIVKVCGTGSLQKLLKKKKKTQWSCCSISCGFSLAVPAYWLWRRGVPGGTGPLRYIAAVFADFGMCPGSVVSGDLCIRRSACHAGRDGRVGYQQAHGAPGREAIELRPGPIACRAPPALAASPGRGSCLRKLGCCEVFDYHVVSPPAIPCALPARDGHHRFPSSDKSPNPRAEQKSLVIILRIPSGIASCLGNLYDG